ncbi:MAG: diacylglycerol kinase family protein [Vicinamibacteria bacterium]
MDQRVFVVFNPHSGKGRGATLIEPVLAALREGGGVEHASTLRAGDEPRLVREALSRGFRTLVAVGGDGTWSNVANVLLAEGAGGDVRLGLVPAGTGCDLAKSLAIPARDVAACARIARAGVPRRIDVGRIEERCFLNVAGFGFDIAVIERSWSVRWLGGDLLYLYCALLELYAFPGFAVEVEADGLSLGRLDQMMLVFPNARIFGGGFRIAPHADLADGRIEMVGFGNMGLFARLGMMGRLRAGSHLSAPQVISRAAARYRLRFERPPAYETDGEWNQAKSAELSVETLPGALTVMAGE